MKKPTRPAQPVIDQGPEPAPAKSPPRAKRAPTKKAPKTPEVPPASVKPRARRTPTPSPNTSSPSKKGVKAKPKTPPKKPTPKPQPLPFGPPPGASAISLKDLEEMERAADAIECERARESLEVFLYRYLPEAFDRAPGGFHRGIYADCEALMRREPLEGAVRDAAAYAYPRGHGKTTTITLGFLLWVISNWRNLAHFGGKPPFILIVSDTFDQARDRSLDLRDQIEGNQALIEDYGAQAPEPGERRRRGRTAPGEKADQGGRWTNADWSTRDGVRVKAVGSGNKVRGLLRAGRRPTLIVCDDLENDQAVSTDAQRGKLERWFKRALIPTGIAGRLVTIAVGTILHADSLLSRFLGVDHYAGWLKRRFSALYNAGGLPDAEGTIPLWPDGWSVEALQARKGEIGSVAFAQEYLNQPIDEESALFRSEWLDAARNRGRGLPFLYDSPPRLPFSTAVSTWHLDTLVNRLDPGIYQYVVTAWDISVVEDAAKARERDTDYTVGITVGLTLDDRVQVRRIFRGRGLTPFQLRARVISEQSVVNADVVVVENNAAQRIHQIELTNIPGLPIRGHTTGRQKHSVYDGVPGLGLLFELGRIDLCAQTQPEIARIAALCTELHGLGSEAHDDLVMALWIAYYAIRRFIMHRDKQRNRLIGRRPNESAPGLGSAPERRETRFKRAA